MDGMSKTAKLVAGVASAVVGVTCLVALVQTQSTGPTENASGSNGKKLLKKSSKKRAKKSKKKSSSSSPSSSSSKPSSKELALKIEQECIDEFKAYLPKIGEMEGQMFQQAQAGGRQMTAAVAEQIQGELIKHLETHLEEFKKARCVKYEVSERRHDATVSKLLDDEDPAIMPLMEESQKLWSVFKPQDSSVAVPEHFDEETAIKYICQSFQLVMQAMKEAQATFTNNESGGLAAFRTRMQSDQTLAKAFNDKFRTLLDAKKKALQQEFGVESEAVVSAIVAKYQGSANFNARVGAAKAEMDAFFQSQ